MQKPEPRWWQLSALDRESRLLWGYFLGVAIGAAAFWPIALLLSLALLPAAEPVALQYPTAPVVLMITLGTVVILIWVITAWWVAFPPFLLVRMVARRLNIRSPYYYLCGGALSGAILGGLYEKVGESLSAGEPGPPDWPGHGLTLTGFCLAGALGALVFWWIAVRPDRAQSPQ